MEKFHQAKHGLNKICNFSLFTLDIFQRPLVQPKNCEWVIMVCRREEKGGTRIEGGEMPKVVKRGFTQKNDSS